MTKTSLPTVAGRRLVVPALLAAIPGSATAVFESPDHTGQALIYPYYTVQSAGGNAFNTYLSVVNSTDKAKALKVRFREGKNGRAVLDLNLYLSPNDTWTAALGPQDGSASSPAILVTSDKSCTTPPVPASGLVFSNASYGGAAADGAPTTLDRTREGYFEIIEMATLQGPAATAVTQNAAGVPFDCAGARARIGSTDASQAAALGAPGGGLSGTFVLINVANGQSFSGNATALGQFSATTLFSDPGSDTPNLASANPPFATTVTQSPAYNTTSSLVMYGATYANGRDAVSAALMVTGLANEYVLDVGTQSATDWVVTFPTKNFYVTPATSTATYTAATPPFTNNFASIGSCEPIGVTVVNREEATPVINGGSFFPEPPPGVSGPVLCWSANVMSMGSTTSSTAISKVFGSVNAMSLKVPFQNGWMQIGPIGVYAVYGLSSVASSGQVLNLSTGVAWQPPTAGGPPPLGPPPPPASTTVLHTGLPAIAFMARTLNNGILNCTTFGGGSGLCAGSYGALMEHRYLRSALPRP